MGTRTKWWQFQAIYWPCRQCHYERRPETGQRQCGCQRQRMEEIYNHYQAKAHLCQGSHPHLGRQQDNNRCWAYLSIPSKDMEGTREWYASGFGAGSCRPKAWNLPLPWWMYRGGYRPQYPLSVEKYCWSCWEPSSERKPLALHFHKPLLS